MPRLDNRVGYRFPALVTLDDMGASKSRKVLPGDIRFLRGDRSRAAFAAELGVSPLTVYRWELDVDAPEARSPRGATAGRLRGMLDAHPNRRPVSDAEVEANLAGERLPVVRALREETRTGEALRLGSVLDAVHRADFRGAETLLLAELSSGALRSRSAQALAAYAQGMVLLFGRNDAHGALGVVLPYLGDAESYGGEVAVRLHVLAAVCAWRTVANASDSVASTASAPLQAGVASPRARARASFEKVFMMVSEGLKR